MKGSTSLTNWEGTIPMGAKSGTRIPMGARSGIRIPIGARSGNVGFTLVLEVGL